MNYILMILKILIKNRDKRKEVQDIYLFYLKVFLTDKIWKLKLQKKN